MDSLIYVMSFTFFGNNATVNKMAWPFAWPNVVNGHLVDWYCKPYNAPSSLILPNYTIVWCINSTFGYINLTNWQWMMQATIPGTPEYDEALTIITAWWEYNPQAA